MTEYISITPDINIGILTLRGSESEFQNGKIPAAWMDVWIRFFVGTDEEAEYPNYDQILFLRNINVLPMVSETAVSPFLPIWHAAAILLSKESVIGLLLITDTAVMDILVQIVPPRVILRGAFPEVDTSWIKVYLEDLGQNQIINNPEISYPVKVIYGWPSVKSRESYQRIHKQTMEYAAMTGNGGSTDITYVLQKSKKVAMKLYFLFCILDIPNETALLVLHDEINPDEAWG